jgi:pimeloyl-ACP methyl ester carboxylesterase
MSVTFEPITGRYMQLDLFGRGHRIYVEEAGHGTPLLCLHTAGADGRQYRGLMNDARVTAKHRVIAFDMPWHGKSTPPDGWQDDEYALTTDAYIEAIRVVRDALDLHRPVTLGCSIGGRIVLSLAIRHAREFRALIGIDAAAYQTGWYDSTWLHRPDVHGGEACAGFVSGLIAPQSPDTNRWDTLWKYMQSGPGVFRGDIHFYRIDSDLRGELAKIDTKTCPLYLMTGEYDFSCTPENSRDTAERVPGAELVIMREVGHFAMSENPIKFRSYLLPILERIHRASGREQQGRFASVAAAESVG